MDNPSTVIFWGAGATASLGVRVTNAQGAFITNLVGASANPASKSPHERVSRSLADNDTPYWHNVLLDLITILGDTPSSSENIHVIEKVHLEAMARHWRAGASADELRKRIMALRLVYDWPALKDVVSICPGAGADTFKINDLFNVLDMHTPLGHGFRAEEGRFLDARRLLGAKNALKMLLHSMFYIDYQRCLETKLPLLKKYYQFAKVLTTRMQRTGMQHSGNFDRLEFIRGNVSFVSLNYDPIGLWVQFVANRDLNSSATAPYVGSPSRPMQVYHDMGHFIPSRRIEPNTRPALWYPMNEASAQRLNEPSAGANQLIRLSKFLFPHGSLCWRECPDCGKLSAYHGDQWSIDSTSLIPPPPLRGFDKRSAYSDIRQLNESDRTARQEEKARWEEGRVDARACLHCGTLTYTNHTQTVMQSSFKQAPPSFIDEIQRDLRAMVMRADHIIFMGYSLPSDDVSYRSFFAARRQRSQTHLGKSVVNCTVVGLDEKNPYWISPTEIRPQDFCKDSAVNSALEIFGEGNVRFFGGGIPAVFLDSAGNVSDQRIEELLTWPTP